MIDFFDFSNLHFYIGILIAVINSVLLCFEGYKFMQIIQLSGYHLKGYFDWLKDTRAKYIVRLLMLTLLSTACFLVTNVIFNAYLDYLAYLGFVFYAVFSIIFIRLIYKAPKKTPLQMTHRMSRGMALLFFVNLIISFGLIVLSSMFIDIFRFGAVALTPIMLPLIVPFVHWLMQPIEKGINKSFVRKAKKRLETMPGLIKIGITGSYGKTSVKNFLHTLLAEKYSVCSTPLNFNTPMGITKTVLQLLAPLDQVLIVEMGARQIGDIKELCEIVDPSFGIVTAVGEQHIATFQSIENVRRTKAELPEYLKSKNGFCVFNLDSENTKKIYDNVNCDKMGISVLSKESPIYATNIVTTTDGTSFILHIENFEEISVNTKLFGQHNINNLLLCVAMAVKLGLTRDELIRGLGRIMPVEHRLQLIKAENDITIIDDAYNSSIEGSEKALEVLALWKDKRKIVITPGLVELGTMERLANYNLGEKIAKVANITIIMNKVHYLPIKQGLIDKGFDETKIYNTDNMDSTKKLLEELLQPHDIVLWENDLPDNYT